MKEVPPGTFFIGRYPFIRPFIGIRSPKKLSS